MPDYHYHANHIDGPPRGSKETAMRDARRLHVLQMIYNDDLKPDLDSPDRGLPGWPLIVRCYRTDCRIVKKGEER